MSNRFFALFPKLALPPVGLPRDQAIPSDFLSECWANTGDVLPDFSVADVFGLQLVSAQSPIDFNICISAITLF
jgi:hypothetical protein